MGYRVRVQGRQALALPMPAIPGQRCAHQRSSARVAGGPEVEHCRKEDAIPGGDSPMNVSRARRLIRSPLLPLIVVSLVVGMSLLPWPAFAALDASDTTWDGSEPPQGIYFHWYEPSFYAGFAPRTQDPQRVHIGLSRGNQ